MQPGPGISPFNLTGLNHRVSSHQQQSEYTWGSHILGHGETTGGNSSINVSPDITNKKLINVQHLSTEAQEAFQPIKDLPSRATLHQVRTQNALKEIVNYIEKIEGKLQAANNALLKYERAILNSDVTIEVEGGREILANKDVLREKSEHFRAMFSHHMAETRTSTVKIHDADPEAVKLMLIHMISSRIPPKTSHYTVIVSMAELANRFNIPELLHAVSKFVETSNSEQTTDLTIHLLKSCQLCLEHESLGALWQQIHDLCCLRLASRVPELRAHPLFAALTLRELIDIIKLVPECTKEWHQVKITLSEGRSVSKDLEAGAALDSEKAIFRAWVNRMGASCTTPRFQWIQQPCHQPEKLLETSGTASAGVASISRAEDTIDSKGPRSSSSRRWPVVYDFLLKHPWGCTEGNGLYTETVAMLPGQSNPPWREDRTVSSLVILNQTPGADMVNELEFGAAMVMAQSQYVLEVVCQWAQAQERAPDDEQKRDIAPKIENATNTTKSPKAISVKGDKHFHFSDPVELLHFVSEVATDEGIQNLPNFKVIIEESLSKYIIHTFDYFHESVHMKYLSDEIFSSILAENDLFTENELHVLKAAMNWAMSMENKDLLHEDLQKLFVFVPNDNQAFGGKIGKITGRSDGEESQTPSVAVIFEVNQKPKDYPLSKVKVFRNPSVILPLVRFPYIAKKDLKFLQNLEWQILKSLPVMQELLQEALHLQNFPRDARQPLNSMLLKSHKILVGERRMSLDLEGQTEVKNQEGISSEGDEKERNTSDSETRQTQKRRKIEDLNQNRKVPRHYYSNKVMPYFQMEDVISCFEA